MSIDINKQQIDIETLFKQNVNDLASIKELYKRLKEIDEKIVQINYIDTTLAKKLKKEYESLKKQILDENIQLQLSNKIDEINSQLNTKTYYCNNVSDMKNRNFKVGDCVITLGYYSINDGGGSTYIIINDDSINEDGGYVHTLTNGLKAKLIIDNNVVRSGSYGVIGKNSNNEIRLNNAIKFCITNKYELNINTSLEVHDVIKITGYIKIYGNGKNTIIQSKGTNENIIQIEFSEPETVDYSFSNLEISDLSIYGNNNATKQNAICFNSVICLYSKIKNINIKTVNGSAINILNDGSRTNKAFYSHNIMWHGIYCESVSNFLSQNNINSPGNTWVYGGEINDVHLEAKSTFMNEDTLFDLTNFYNLKIKNIITEGNTFTNVKSIYKCNKEIEFEKIYFEFKPQNKNTIKAQFELSGPSSIIKDVFNFENVLLTNPLSVCRLVNIGTIKTPMNIAHTDNQGRIYIDGVKFGSWISGLSFSDVIPNQNGNVKYEKFTIGNINLSTINNKNLFYTLDKQKYIDKNLDHQFIKYWNILSDPTMTVENDIEYGKVIKLVSTNEKQRVFNGLLVKLPSIYYDKKLCVVAKFKWSADTTPYKTSTNLIGTAQSILIDSDTVTNNTWITSIGIWNISENVYIRFDYNDDKVATENQTLYIADIKIYIGDSLDLI